MSDVAIIAASILSVIRGAARNMETLNQLAQKEEIEVKDLYRPAIPPAQLTNPDIVATADGARFTLQFTGLPARRYVGGPIGRQCRERRVHAR